VRLVEGNRFDTIYHECFSYFSFLTARRLLSAHGLEVFDVDEVGPHGGSLRQLANEITPAARFAQAGSDHDSIDVETPNEGCGIGVSPGSNDTRSKMSVAVFGKPPPARRSMQATTSMPHSGCAELFRTIGSAELAVSRGEVTFTVLSARNRAVAISPFVWPETANRPRVPKREDQRVATVAQGGRDDAEARGDGPDRRDQRSFHLVLEHQRPGAGAYRPVVLRGCRSRGRPARCARAGA
jgi:hypothetical protein